MCSLTSSHHYSILYLFNMDKAETDSKWLVGYGAVLAGIVGYLWYTRQSYNSSEEAA